MTNNFFFGLPIVLNTNFSAGASNTFSVTHSYYDGLMTTAQYGTYLKDNHTVEFDKHRSRTEAFYGAAFHLQELKGGNSKKGMLAQYVWNYSNDATSPDRVFRAMQDISEKTGDSELLMRVPTAEDMGFVSLTFTLTYSEDQLRYAMGRTAAMSKEDMLAKVSTMVARYRSANPADPQQCSIMYENLDWARCTMDLDGSTARAASDMYDSLQAMRAAFAKGDDTQFATASANYGKAMMTNQITFKLAALLAGRGLNAEYLVEGRDISRYIMELTSTNSADRTFVRASRP
jgi:hypothetical protein